MYCLGAHPNIQGSNDLQTSVAGVEILPIGTDGKTISFDDFDFTNDQVCHVFINGSTSPIYIRASQGVNLSYIYSFKVVEDGITFNWVGCQR